MAARPAMEANGEWSLESGDRAGCGHRTDDAICHEVSANVRFSNAFQHRSELHPDRCHRYSRLQSYQIKLRKQKWQTFSCQQHTQTVQIFAYLHTNA